MQKFYDCGIDLGTTNSCLAIPNNDYGYEIIDNQKDRMTVTPSAVYINAKGRMLIGQRAYNSIHVDDLALQFKRAMGAAKMFEFASTGTKKSPEELSAEVLRLLKSNAEAVLNRRIENVVITVPAAFKTLQSEATNRAGIMAGFKNIVLLQEPVAAAVAYGAKPGSKDKHWMVFDYGGGTLDVAIISTADGRLVVENSEGDNFFGGCDIDRLIFKEIIKKKLVEEGYQIDELLDEKTPAGRSAVRQILLICEGCKIDLSFNNSTVFELYDIDDDADEPIEFQCEITRAELESVISDTIDKSIEIAEKALSGAGLKPYDLDKILLVGGSTFIPLVKERLKEEFKVELDSSINPMTVVAAGAAIYASTSIVDIEEETRPTDSTHALISLTYDAISSAEKVNVIGKVINNSKVSVSRIRIEGSASAAFSNIDFTSGWIDLVDGENGIFDIDVALQPGKMNYFKVSACNAQGKEIIVENPVFEIKHNENVLRNTAPTATATISIEIKDPDSDRNILVPMVRKNTPLPASVDRTYRLTRDIDPVKDDIMTISIWEGEGFDNPQANHWAGDITVQASAIGRFVPQNTEIEVTVEEDEGRQIHVYGYIPDFDFEIPSETLRVASKEDLEERMESVGARIEQSELNLKKLKEEGVDVTELEEELADVKAAYDDTSELVDSDEQAVHGFINKFGEIETRIINQEQKAHEEKKAAVHDEKIADARKQVEDWGDDDAKAALEELEDEYLMAETDDEKAFVLQKIVNHGFMTMTGNFDWLRGFFMVILSKPERTYTNPQKAEYWKSQAYQAIENRNTAQLRNAVFELLDLSPSGSGGASTVIAAYSDLTV